MAAASATPDDSHSPDAKSRSARSPIAIIASPGNGPRSTAPPTPPSSQPGSAKPKAKSSPRKKCSTGSVRQSSSPAEIRDLIVGLTDVTQALRDANGEAKAEIYTALGLHLTYRPNQRQVDVIAAPKAVDVSACRRAVG